MNSDATLDELEGRGWADPDYPSPLVQRIRALGRVPLREFTAEDFRLVLTQKRALRTLVPLALDLLEAEPFAEGDFYPGDVLLALSRVPVEYWQRAPDLRERLQRVLAGAIARLDELDTEDRQGLEPELRAIYDAL